MTRPPTKKFMAKESLITVGGIHLSYVGSCDNCGYEAELTPWSGGLDAINSIRMYSSLPKWCEICMLEAQIGHMEFEMERIKDELPSMKNKLSMMKSKRTIEQAITRHLDKA